MRSSELHGPWLANLRPRCVDAGARLGRGVLPSLCSTPARARAPPSHPTVMCRVPPSGRTPQGSGWRDGAHYQRVPLNSVVLDRATPAPSAAHSCFGMYLVMMQQALRAVTRKTEATVCVSLRSVGFSAKDHLNSRFSGWHPTQPAAHLTVASARTWRCHSSLHGP
jgi:hypothetical protein